MVTFRASGLVEAAAASHEAAQRMLDMGDVLTIAAEDLRVFVDDRFRTGTDPQGDPWHPLEPPTVAARRKGRKSGAGGKDSILVDTAVLRNSITAKVTARNRITIGTNIEYAIYHQLGTEAMFERPFIPIGEDFKSGIGQGEVRNIERLLTAWIVRGELG